MRRLVTLLLLGCAFAVAIAPAATASNAPLQVDFVKHLVDPSTLTFEGTTSGAVSGDLTTRVSVNNVSGPIIHMTVDWIVSAGDESFTAQTSGTWNTVIGQVVLDGSVISGYLNGAQVHEEGHLVDPSTLTFEGFLRLMPATAG